MTCLWASREHLGWPLWEQGAALGRLWSDPAELLCSYFCCYTTFSHSMECDTSEPSDSVETFFFSPCNIKLHSSKLWHNFNSPAPGPMLQVQIYFLSLKYPHCLLRRIHWDLSLICCDLKNRRGRKKQILWKLYSKLYSNTTLDSHPTLFMVYKLLCSSPQMSISSPHSIPKQKRERVKGKNQSSGLGEESLWYITAASFLLSSAEAKQRREKNQAAHNWIPSILAT